MDETITIILDKNGGMEIETHNFQGAVCEKVCEQILVGMGGTATKQTKKPEYYEGGDNPVEVLTKA